MSSPSPSDPKEISAPEQLHLYSTIPDENYLMLASLVDVQPLLVPQPAVDCSIARLDQPVATSSLAMSSTDPPAPPVMLAPPTMISPEKHPKRDYVSPMTSLEESRNSREVKETKERDASIASQTQVLRNLQTNDPLNEASYSECTTEPLAKPPTSDSAIVVGSTRSLLTEYDHNDQQESAVQPSDYRYENGSQISLPASPVEDSDPSLCSLSPTREVDEGEGQSVLQLWKPPTLRPWFLLGLLTFQLAIIGAIEALDRVSSRNTGLTTISENDSLSKTFLWAYLPTAIALIVGKCWAALELDVIRTEPYVRLSEPKGAEIGVIFDQSLLNPFRAMWMISKSRIFRWREKPPKYSMVAFCSVAAYIISFFILPALQSSMMSAKIAETPIKSDFIRMPSFNTTNPLRIADWLSLINAAGDRFSLGGSPESIPTARPIAAQPVRDPSLLPMKDPMAILPVVPLNNNSDSVSIWESTSAAYMSRLQCSFANVSRFSFIDGQTADDLLENTQMPGKTRINFADLQYPIAATFAGLGDRGGCQFTIEVPLAKGEDPIGNQTDEWFYGGWHFLDSTNGSSDTSCNEYMYLNLNTAALTYTKSANKSLNYEATFATIPTFNSLLCKSTYLMAESINVTFGNNSIVPSAIIDRHDFDTKAKVIPDSIFNSTMFEEYLLSDVGRVYVPGPSSNSSGLPTIVQTDFPRGPAWFTQWTTPALRSATNTSLLEIVAEVYLQGGYVENINLKADGWRSRSVERLSLVRSTVLQRLFINSGYAKATQAVLGFLVLLIMLVLFLGRRRKTSLLFDPSTIAAAVALVARSVLLRKLFEGQGLIPFLFNQKESLRLTTTSGGGIVLDVCQEIDHGEAKGVRGEPIGLTQSTNQMLIRSARESLDLDKLSGKPFVLKRKIIHLCLLVFALSIFCAVISLWTVAYYHSGLNRGSFYIKVGSVNQFAWTIIPILAVICLKFSWSVVDTYFRLLQPYISISRNHRNSPTTLATSYETTVVGWVTIKSLMRRNYMLCVITLISLLNEVLIMGVGALFKSQTVAVASEAQFSANLALRTTPLKFPDASKLAVLENSPSVYVTISANALVGDYVIAKWSLSGGRTANWTTQDYAFCPLQFHQNSGPQNSAAEWSVETIGIHARAQCTPLSVPIGIFERIAVPQSQNSSDGVVYGYEFRDWTQNIERVDNSITYRSSVFRIPREYTGIGRMTATAVSGNSDIQQIMNYTGFWGPLWSANVSQDGQIYLPNIPAPGPVEYNQNHTRDATTLPEVFNGLGHFVVGWAQYPRIQYSNTSSWYSPTIPKHSFLVCNSTFQQFPAKATVDPETQAILSYQALGSPKAIDNVTDFAAVYLNNDTTSISAGFGSAFLLRSFFEGDPGATNPFRQQNLEVDIPSDVASSMMNNMSQMLDGDNLTLSTEKAFSTFFSQWAAVPGNVFVNQDPQLVKDDSLLSQTRIIVSTPAMIIVVTLLGILILALAALPWWTRSWEKCLIGLKREPDVLGAVLGYVCDSPHLLGLSQGHTFTKMSQLEEFLKKADKRFRIGKFIGEDGKLCYGIEVEDETTWVEDETVEEPRKSKLRLLSWMRSTCAHRNSAWSDEARE